MSEGEKKFFIVGVLVSVVLAVLMTVCAGDYASSMVNTTFEERVQEMTKGLFN